MKVVLLSLVCFTAFSILLYVFAGRILRSGPPDRLARTARICFWSYLAAAALTILCVRTIFEPEVSRPLLIVLIYAFREWLRLDANRRSALSIIRQVSYQFSPRSLGSHHCCFTERILRHKEVNAL